MARLVGVLGLLAEFLEGDEAVHDGIDGEAGGGVDFELAVC